MRKARSKTRLKARIKAGEDRLGELLFKARAGMSAARVRDLESRLASDADDLEARADLLSHFAATDQIERVAPHLKYLMTHHPGLRLFDFPFLDPRVNPELSEQVRLIWMLAVDSESDLRIPLQALSAIGSSSFVDGERMVGLGLINMPDDVRWLHASADFYLLHGQRSPSLELFERASELFQRALALTTTPSARVAMLIPALISALEAHHDACAAALAGETLSASDDGSPRKKGLKYYGHAALGELALRAGDLDEAERRLLASAQELAGVNLDDLGPRLELAKQLVEDGRRSAVITYLGAVLKQWPDGWDTLAPWLEKLRAEERTSLK